MKNFTTIGNLEDVRKDMLNEAERYEDWHTLPSDMGIYAIEIVETGELYIGGTMKKPAISGGAMRRFGIYDRISHHLTAYPTWSTSRISKAMHKVYIGELHAVYYVIARTIDETYANELETYYISMLSPELNTQKHSNLKKTGRELSDAELGILEVEELEPAGLMALPQTRYIIKGKPNARRMKITI